MKSRPSVPLVLILLLGAWPALAEQEEDETTTDALTDWMNIVSFSVEAALGSGVDENGELTGETATFPAAVGVVFCRVDIIGADQPQAITVIWYREDEEVSRSKLRLTPENPHDVTQRQIPAAQAGSWRVEIVSESDEVLAVLPFVVGESSTLPAAPRKKTNEETPAR